MKKDPYTGLKDINNDFEKIFQKYWIAIGVTNLIHKKNDFILRNIGGKEIIIRNDGEKIRAFLNQCQHRNSPIFHKPKGNSQLICSFHGWSYANSGELSNLPFNDENYGFDEKTCDNIKLKEYALEIIGKFIFINLEIFPIDIKDQFDSNMIKELEDISIDLDDDISITSIPIKASFKLMMEITKDSLHPVFVHANTFKIKYDPKKMLFANSNKNRNVNYESKVAVKELSYATNAPNNNPKETWFSDVKRYKNNDLYYDFFFFPNLHLFSGDAGHSFGYSIYFPEDVDKTIVDYSYILRKKIKPNRIFPIVHYEAIKYGLMVYEEDIKMMEKVQGILNKNYSESMHGVYEEDIKKFKKFLIFIAKNEEL